MNAITSIRKSLGLSQAALGAALNLSQSAISQFEKGICEPTPEVARRLISLAQQNGIDVNFDSIYARPNGDCNESATAEG